MSSVSFVDQLDSREETAAALAQVRADALEVGARRLALAAHWADLHPFVDPVPSMLPGRPRGRRVGADGTPMVEELAAAELAALLGVHTQSALALMADTANLRHRHPMLWARVMNHEVVDWVAVKTAREVAAAGLDVEQARWVDEVTSAYASTLSPGRYLSLVQAKVVEADPEAAEAKRLAAALERFVSTGRSDEHGLKTLIARATAGEIIYLVAVLDRIAQILALQGDEDPVEVRRSKALGILATPARALQLLAWAEQEHPDPEQSDEPSSARNDADLNAAVAAGLAKVDPKRLLPPATLYLHLSYESWVTGRGVARMEGVGPVTIEQVRDFLRHSHVTVTPVLDLEGGMPVDAYEIPDRMQHVTTLRYPHEVFPWATGGSRGADKDHSRRYVPPDEGGPPGQTHPDKLGPLGRRHHRVKTHGRGWRHHQISPGVFLWRTPTGHWTRVDRHGTHIIGPGVHGPEISVMEQHFTALIGV